MDFGILSLLSFVVFGVLCLPKWQFSTWNVILCLTLEPILIAQPTKALTDILVRPDVETWGDKQKCGMLKMTNISKLVAPESTYFAWCPDDEHVLTVAYAPGLGVNQGYRLDMILTLSYTSMCAIHCGIVSGFSAAIFRWTISGKNSNFPSSSKWCTQGRTESSTSL